jgi:hypothetical protein
MSAVTTFHLLARCFKDNDEPRLPLNQCCDEGSSGAFNQARSRCPGIA